MRIKQRLFFYNTISVLAALITMLMVSGFSMRTVTSIYHKWSHAQIDARAVYVQELLAGWDVSSQNWDELDQLLQEFNYRLSVTVWGHPIHSSLDPTQIRLLTQSMRPDSWIQDRSITVQHDGVLMVGIQRGPYTIVSMPRRTMPVILGSERLPAEAATLLLLISGGVAIAVIFLLNLLFTNHQVKKLLAPVDALTQAALRVEQGDLSQSVDYEGNDEFSSVCSAFNHMQEHLLAERNKSAAYEQARTDLVSGISHDLRTPLTSVKGYIKGLRDGVAQTPEKQMQYLDIAYRKACDMDVLLQRLFYFSKLEMGNLPLFPEFTDLRTLAARFVRDNQAELASSNCEMVLNCPADTFPVRIDTEQMYRVLTNLLDNALRYAGTSPLVLTLSLWQEKDWVGLRFADNGNGVPEDQLPHLFDQFWRGDQARRSKAGEGSGLGLYIVKFIVEAHGGIVRAYCDHGLVYEITLPRKEDTYE